MMRRAFIRKEKKRSHHHTVRVSAQKQGKAIIDSESFCAPREPLWLSQEML
jgi:hypothetical protein